MAFKQALVYSAHRFSRTVRARMAMLSQGSLLVLRIGAGTVFGVGLLLAFVVIWRRVLVGSAVMVGGDVLYCCPPWNGATGAHQAVNVLVADPVDQFLPWLKLTAQAFAAGRLPLWDPLSMTGKPLLANDQSASFSPFTWLAILVGGARGYSLAMLAKLWVAGLGMVVYSRLLGARPLAAAVGALAYAAGSFMVVWLAWPHAGVAALLPWVFAAVEWYLRRPSPVALAAVSAAVCTQFLAGHAETSLHLGVAAAIYVAVRCLDRQPGRLWALAGLALGGALGIAAASIQLIPFLQELRGSSLISDRQGVVMGSAHLPLSALTSWLAPNLRGNPAIDHMLGRPPNYNESTGFAGVGALVLAGVGALRSGMWAGASTTALLTVGLFAAATIYSPLSWLTGRLPGLSASYNVRMLVLLTFVVGALAGLGLEALLSRRSRQSAIGSGLLAIGLLGLVATVVLSTAFALFRVRVEGWLPAFPRGVIGFWVLVAVASLLAALGLSAAGWLRGGQAAPAGLAALALIEAALFAGPYQPQVPPAEVPPRSQTLAWLQANASDSRIAGTGLVILPETATLYGLADARGYDVVRSARIRAFWSRADPDFHDEALITLLERPGENWLAAAGVRYVVTPGDQLVPGTEPVFRGEGVTIAEVPNARPLAFAATSTACATGIAQAGEMMTANGPLGPVVLEGASCPSGSPAKVQMVSRQPERLELVTESLSPTVVVVLQTYTPDWKATVDGRAASLMAADVLFQAVAVPGGEHRLVLRYQPASVAVGGAVSGITAAMIAALVVVGALRWRRHR